MLGEHLIASFRPRIKLSVIRFKTEYCRIKYSKKLPSPIVYKKKYISLTSEISLATI